MARELVGTRRVWEYAASVGGVGGVARVVVWWCGIGASRGCVVAALGRLGDGSFLAID